MLVIAIAGAILTAEGPNWIEVDKPDVMTKSISSGESFDANGWTPQFHKTIGNLESSEVADVIVKRIIPTASQNEYPVVLDLRGHIGQFEMTNDFNNDFGFYEITITNPERFHQGKVSYTLTLQRYQEQSSSYQLGNALLVSGVLGSTFTLFKPRSILKIKNAFLQMKLFDTMIRMSAICISFVGIIIIELRIITQLVPSNILLNWNQPINLAVFLFSILSISLFPLALFAYFISPAKIKRDWKLHQAAEDPDLQRICNDLAKEIGLEKPPKSYITNESSATAFVFGTTLGNYKLIIGSNLKKELTEQELTSVVAHELSHALHRDMAFMTWGEVFLSFAKYWLIVITISTLVIISLNLIPLGNRILSMASFSISVLLYSFYLINSISRDREIASDIRSAYHTSPVFLKAALIKTAAIKMKKMFKMVVGNRLLFYSNDIIYPSFIRKILDGFFSTHPGLSTRIKIIERKENLKPISLANIIHIGLIAGFTLMFFTNTLQIIAARHAGGGEWGLFMFSPTGIIVGFLYGTYFAYNKKHDIISQDFGYAKKALVVWASCFLSFILANSYAFVGWIPTSSDLQSVLVPLVLSSMVFLIAFPASILFQLVFKYIFR